MGEEGNILVGDVVVGDATIAAVADVLCREEVALIEIELRAIRRRRLAGAPQPGERKARVAGPLQTSATPEALACFL
jgi:hypothetical protein